jgi:hypothetical protein
MSTFADAEKAHQISFKAASSSISRSGRTEGLYMNEPRPFCLPEDHARENLFPDIRAAAIDFFWNGKILWHQGIKDGPTNHLCSSQVCCVNFLFPFADKPLALRDLLLPVFPTIRRMLPVESGRYVTFEWIGAKNYLGEKVPKNTERTRGANCTSADACVRFEEKDGRIHTVLIEWKYTESYSTVFLKTSKNGTDRTTIYQHLYDHAGCPLNKSLIPKFEDLFYEPFYQFMRQQFLAHAMETIREDGMDIVSVLHIAPRANQEFKEVTSPALRILGSTATEVWGKLVTRSDRFRSIHTGDLFGPFDVTAHPELKAWRTYIEERYPGVLR